MTRGAPTNDLGREVLRRLRALARQRGVDTQSIVEAYCVERMLFRLSASRHAPDLVLKGSMLFRVWGGAPLRPTLFARAPHLPHRASDAT